MCQFSKKSMSFPHREGCLWQHPRLVCWTKWCATRQWLAHRNAVDGARGACGTYSKFPDGSYIARGARRQNGGWLSWGTRVIDSTLVRGMHFRAPLGANMQLMVRLFLCNGGICTKNEENVIIGQTANVMGRPVVGPQKLTPTAWY